MTDLELAMAKADKRAQKAEIKAGIKALKIAYTVRMADGTTFHRKVKDLEDLKELRAWLIQHGAARGWCKPDGTPIAGVQPAAAPLPTSTPALLSNSPAPKKKKQKRVMSPEMRQFRSDLMRRLHAEGKLGKPKMMNEEPTT